MIIKNGTTVLLLIILATFFAKCKEESESIQSKENALQIEEKTASDILLDSLKADANPGDVIITDTYQTDNLSDGDYQFFYPDSTIKVMGTIVNGKREGVWTAYHPNGIIQSENEYSNGVLNGKCMAKKPNGQMIYIGYYFNGKYDGQWLYFNNEGEIEKEVYYSKGKVSKVVEGDELPQ
jgi:antitoxin component YwqK of YwqJK toxin-antitoxin module